MVKLIINIIILVSINVFAQNNIDTLKPEISVSGECGYYTVNITEKKNGNPGDNPRQIETGISRVPFLDAESENFLPVKTGDSFSNDTANFDFNIYLEVEDKFKPAKAVFVIIDNANPPNILFDSIKYNPNLISFNYNFIDFGNVRLNTTDDFNITGINRSKDDFYIDSVYLTNGSFFHTDYNYKRLLLRENSIFNFNVFYSPENDILYTGESDYDTLIVQTECLEYKIPLSGNGVMPQIKVQDHNFEWHFKGDVICKMPLLFPHYDEGLLISNPGSDTLRITGFYHYNENSPLMLSKPSSPEIPELSIAPGDTTEVFKLCFTPVEQGEYFNRIYFESNASGPDSVCNAYAISFIKGPYFEDFNFPKIRVGDTSKAFLKFRNNGDIPVAIEDFYLEGDNNAFKIIKDEIFPPIPSNGFLIVYPENYDDPNVIKSVNIPIEFSPEKEHDIKSKIRAVFQNEVRNDTSNVYNYLRGAGFIPKIDFNNYTFTPEIMINTVHPDTAKIIIKNTSTSGRLYIKNTETVERLSNSEHFRILNNLPVDLYIPERSSYEINILYMPLSRGEHTLTLRIYHDEGAYETPQIKDELITLKGTGYKNLEIPSEVTFQEIPHCQSDFKYIKIKNLSILDSLIIDSLIITGNNNIAFEADKQNLNIAPGETDSVRITFMPFKTNSVYNYAYLKLYNQGDIYNINLTGRSRISEVIITVDTLRNISPGVQTIVYEGTDISDDFRINIYSDNWQEIDIDTLSFKLLYKHFALRFTDIINEGDFSLKSINYTDRILNDSLSELSINLSLENFIQNDGILIKPVFDILLSKNLKFYSYLTELTLGGKEDCIEVTEKSGYIALRGCNIEIRRIVTSEYNYESLQLKPNPATNDEVEITYTIGLKNHTKIEMLNPFGKVIKVISDKIQNAGRYSLILNTAEIPSGTYNIRITSGNYVDNEKLILIK